MTGMVIVDHVYAEYLAIEIYLNAPTRFCKIPGYYIHIYIYIYSSFDIYLLSYLLLACKMSIFT